MTKNKTVNGTLTIGERLTGSINGNPRYSVIINGILYKTGVDSSLGDTITNFDGEEVTATVRIYRNQWQVVDVSLA